MFQYAIESPGTDTPTLSVSATQTTPSMEVMFEIWLQNRNIPLGNPLLGPHLKPQTKTQLLCQGYDNRGKPITYCWSLNITKTSSMIARTASIRMRDTKKIPLFTTRWAVVKIAWYHGEGPHKIYDLAGILR